MTTEENIGMGIEVLIDPNRPGIKPTCKGIQRLRVSAPHGGSKTIWSPVGQPDGFVDVLVLDDSPSRVSG